MDGSSGAGRSRLDDFCRLVAEDLRTLAMLHDRELDRTRIEALQRSDNHDFLGLALTGTRGKEILAFWQHGIDQIPNQPSEHDLDQLAADYAAIYLNNSFQVSPCESVWLDEESLTMQEPMFQIRNWYAKYRLAVPDWRRRTDDHLVHQLEFMAYLAELRTDEGLADLARFLDEHPLRWLEGFAERLLHRAGTPFYAALGMLTYVYLDQLRDLLAELLDEARPSAEEIEQRMNPRPDPVQEVPVQFMPGTSPSW